MLLFLITSFTSCKKEGCTDPNASNYNPAAEVNDGSCSFADESDIQGHVDDDEDEDGEDEDGEDDQDDENDNEPIFKALVDGEEYIPEQITIDNSFGFLIAGSTSNTHNVFVGGLQPALETQEVSLVYTQYSPPGSMDIYEPYMGEITYTSIDSTNLSGTFFFSAAFEGDTVHITEGQFSGLSY